MRSLIKKKLAFILFYIQIILILFILKVRLILNRTFKVFQASNAKVNVCFFAFQTQIH